MYHRLTFGGELRRLRESVGLSLAALADRTHYSKGQLSKIETGKARPSLRLAVRSSRP
jgi:transcriptional regulator with XRE-family HTH domain